MEEPNDHNNVFRTISLSDLVHGHTGNPSTRIRITSSDILPPSIARPELSLPWSLIRTSSLADFTTSIPEVHYTVPANMFAESCPSCDEIAVENVEEGFVARYPRGWLLVACKRHAQMLKASGNGKHICVGGQPELRSKAAYRFQERELKPKEQKAAEKRAATVAISPSAGDKTPSTPPSTPASSSTTTPTNPAQKDPCPICVDSIPNLRLDCNHSFCKPCLTHWQQNFTDQPLSDWITSTPGVRVQYPILAANLKSRFTCPMCRTYLQFTKQSRRKKKTRNQLARGEEVGVPSARSRRGGQRRRRPRVGDGLRSEGTNALAENACVIAPDSMPVVARAQAMQDDSTGLG